MVNFGLLTAEICWLVCGTLANFNGFQLSRLGFVTAPTLLNRDQPNFARGLAISGLVHSVYIFGESCPLTEFCQVQNSLCVQVLHSAVLTAFMHDIRAVGISQTLRHGTRNDIMGLSLVVIFNRGRLLYSEGGHHVGHGPTF